MRLPHPLVLLLGGVALAAILTWILPAGSYQRRTDPATGSEVVVAGTYARVAPAPVGPMAMLLSVPRGIAAGIDVMLTIFFVGGTFALLEMTGALGRLVGALSGNGRNPRTVVVMVSVLFAALGALDNTQEEIIALMPVLLVLSRVLGFGAVTAMAMSVGAAVIGSAFGPTNPFQAGIAHRFAGMPAISQPLLGMATLVVAVAVWIAWTLAQTRRDDVHPDVARTAIEAPTRRDVLLLAIAVVPFAPYVYGVLRFGWGFNELSALFLVAGFAVGLASGRSLSGTAADLLDGMRGLLAAAMFVGVARAISVELTDGRVLDTIVHGLATPLASAPRALAAPLMIVVQSMLHVPVPSVSAQAALSMPIMAPLSDLLGVSRDAAVFAYQTGAGLTDMLTPTSGSLLALLLCARVGLVRWLRFAVPGVLLVGLVGLAATVIAA